MKKEDFKNILVLVVILFGVYTAISPTLSGKVTTSKAPESAEALLVTKTIATDLTSATPRPSMTVQPSKTPAASSTPVPVSSATPTASKVSPSPTLTSAAAIEDLFGNLPTIQEFTVFQGGYTVRVPARFRVSVAGNTVYVQYPEDRVSVTATGSVKLASQTNAGTLQSAMLNYLSQDWESFEVGKAETVQLAGESADLLDFAGTKNGDDLKGRLVVRVSGSSRALVVFSLSEPGTNSEDWDGIQRERFDELLQGLSLMSDEALIGVYECPVATDASYGFTVENPIKVGGSSIVGPGRERAYLDNLSNADGSPVDYQHEGSVKGETTILDQYLVRLNGTDNVLYLDVYNFEPMSAPAGFDCLGMFPLSDLAEE